MKRFIGLASIILFVITGSYFLYGSNFLDPDKYNLSIVNETNIKFKKIGLSNEKFTTILTDVNDDNLESHKELYFYIEKIKNNNPWIIKAIDKNGKVYEGSVNILKNDKLKITNIKKNKLITNKDCKNRLMKVNFNIKKLVKNWDYKIDHKVIKSKYKSDYKNSTDVMGKNNKLKSSKITSKNNEAFVSLEKGYKNYSWVNIYY